MIAGGLLEAIIAGNYAGYVGMHAGQAIMESVLNPQQPSPRLYQESAAAVTVSEQEREVAEALFGLANMAALHSSSPPGSPARSASPLARSEEAIANTSTAVTAAAAVLVQASSPALSTEGDDDSQPIISLKSTPATVSNPVTVAMEEQKQVAQRPAKREGTAEAGAPPASTNLPPLEGGKSDSVLRFWKYVNVFYLTCLFSLCKSLST